MIKKTKNTKQQLLRKNSGESQAPPFEIEDCYSSVGNEDRDSGDQEQSYYCLEKELVNPYFVEMTSRTKEEEKPISNHPELAGERKKMDNLP